MNVTAKNVEETQGPLAAQQSRSDARLEVSAFVDGELDDAAVERVIDALLASDDLAAFWSDAHRAGDWMRSDEVIGVGDGASFLRRFSVQFASEPAIVAPKRSRGARSRRFWVRTGLPGASVAAALVVVAWVAIPLGGGADRKAALPSVAVVPAAKGDEVAVQQAGFKAVDPEQYSEYLAAHREVTPFAYRGTPAAHRAAYDTTNVDAP